MEKQNIFKKLKWDSIIVAALTIILGLLCVILPKGSGTALTYIFGAALVAMGITAVVRYFWGLRLISDMSLVIGTLMITLGVFTLINPSAIQSILVVLLGVFIIIDSMTEISESIYCARANVSGWFWLFLASVLTLGLGIVVAFSNFETVMILAGVALIIEGLKRLIITLVCAGKIREAKKQLMSAANEIIIE